MRMTVPLIALLLATGAAPPDSSQSASPGESPLQAPDAKIDPTSGKTVCRDTIQQVREERGLPWVDRGSATNPDEPLLIAAVHKTIDGCAVMVMRDDTRDVRPLPRPQEHRLMPAK